MTTNLSSIFAGGFVPARMMDEVRSDPEAEFLKVLSGFGLDVSALSYETLERVRTTDDKGGERSGWYVYYPSGIPSGAYGDWRNGGESQTWCSKKQDEMSPAEWMENKRRMEEAKRKRQAQIEATHKAAAATAVDILSQSQPATDDHPYLKAKNVKAHGIFIQNGNLVIPAIDDNGQVTTIETIDQSGKKMFLKGGKKSGSYFWIDGGLDTVYICEGYSTAATVHEATGCACVVAFDAGNLPKVAPKIRSRYLNARIVMAADNDQFKSNGNAGIKCAREAAELIGADVVIPQFSDLTSHPTDFNDLMSLEGMDRVRQQLVGNASIATPRTRFEFSRVDGLEIKDIEWSIKGYLESDSFNLAFGEPGCGKSFIAIDMACCIATGTPWHGHEVKQGLVIYIAGEGHNGLARRFKAWELAHGVPLAGAPLYKSHRAAQLYDMKSALEVAEAINAISQAEGVAPSMVVMDTVARNMGGDENSTQDMNQFIEHIDSLIRHPHKAAILLVHHSGKASPGQARGSTALRGALDAEYQVEMDQSSKMITLTNRKMKDGEIPAEKKFSIKKVGLGVIGKDGDEISGAALETVDISGLLNAVKDKSVTLTKNQNIAFRALTGLVKMRELEPVFVPITTDDWRDSCHENGLERNRFREAKDALSAKSVVHISSIGIVTLASETVRKDVNSDNSDEVKVKC